MKKLYILILTVLLLNNKQVQAQCSATLIQGNPEQCISLGSSITDIVHSLSGDISRIAVDFLPPGIDTVTNGNNFRIFGTPSDTGLYYYIVYLIGSDGNLCALFGGSIRIRTLSLAEGSGERNQTVCLNTPIRKIVFNIEAPGDRTGIPPQDFCGLPKGVFGITSFFNHDSIQITGTPSESGVFKYFISSGNECPLSDSGIITVNELPIVTLDTSSLSLCGQSATAIAIVDSVINIHNPGFDILYKANDHSKIAERIPARDGIYGWRNDSLSGPYNTRYLTFCDNTRDSAFTLDGWQFDFSTTTPVYDGFGIESALIRYVDGDTRRNILNLNGPVFTNGDNLVRGISQVLEDELQQDATYKLTADFGWAITSSSYAPPLLRLYAGNTLLSPIDSTQPSLTQGNFVTWSKTYKVSDPGISGPLTIEVGKNEGGGVNIQIDNVTLKKLRSGNYDFLWNADPSLTDTIVRGLPLGLNSVKVTDHNAGCSIKKEFVNSNPTPVIVQQPFPANDTACAGETATFIVAASGGNLTYQWYKGNDEINASSNASAVTSTLVLSNVQPLTAGTYKVKVSSQGCSVFSDSSTLHIDALQVINSQPSTVNVSYCSGTIAAPLSVQATGAGLRYQWFSNTVPSNEGGTYIVDSVNATLTPSTNTEGVLYYYCEVSGLCGSAIKSRVSGSVTVNVPPIFTSQFTPAQNICTGAVASEFSVSATGSGVLQYQWYKNNIPDIIGGSLVTGATQATFSPSAFQADTFYYYCVVSNACPPGDTSEISEPVIIRPLPTASISGTTTVCQNSDQPLITFDGSGGSAPYFFVYRINGITTDTTASVRNDSGFVNVPTNTVNTFNYSLVSVTDSYGCTQVQTGTATVTVINKPALTSSATINVCDSTAFNYTATSSSNQTNFTWVRNAMPIMISNATRNGSGINGTAIINDTLNNITSLPVVVPYYFTLSTGQGCVTNDSLLVTVNPTPVISPLSNLTYCNGDIDFDGIPFSSTSPNTAFEWTSNKTVGFGIGPSPNITSFIASNQSALPLIATDTVSIYIANNPQCKGSDVLFTITVNPSADKPDFTWLDINNNDLCSKANNINFNIVVPVSGTSYLWQTLPANSTNISIKDNNNSNTVISFSAISNDSVKVIATNNNGGCRDSVVQRINVLHIGNITEEQIVLKQPGNILIYPDNTMDVVSGYQWGYDSLITSAPDYSFSAPTNIDGQVYQFFIPDSNKFFSGSQLDTVKYKYWVLLQKGGCYTKVYYNGPYARRPIPGEPPADNAIRLSVMPNPNDGNFNINLKGNIYGKISAVIYNSLGQVVFTKQFVKSLPDIKEAVAKNNLSKGLYYLQISSSDLKKATTRFIIQH